MVGAMALKRSVRRVKKMSVPDHEKPGARNRHVMQGDGFREIERNGFSTSTGSPASIAARRHFRVPRRRRGNDHAVDSFLAQE